MGDTNSITSALKTAAGYVGEGLAPKVPYPVDPKTGEPMVPPGTSSWVDRGLPILGALGSLASNSEPFSGYLRGRAVQQGIASPFQEVALRNQAAIAERTRRVEGLQGALAQTQDPQQRKLIEASILAFQNNLPPEATIRMLNPPPPKMPTKPVESVAASNLVARGLRPNTLEWTQAWGPEVMKVDQEYRSQKNAEDVAQQRSGAAFSDSLADANRRGTEAAAAKRASVQNLLRDPVNLRAYTELVEGGNPDPSAEQIADHRGKAAKSISGELTVADWNKKNKYTLYDSRTLRPVTPKANQDLALASDVTVPLGKGDEKDLHAYGEQLRALKDVKDNLHVFDAYLTKHPDIADLVAQEGWASTNVSDFIIRKDPSIRPYVAKLNYLIGKKVQEVNGTRASDYERKNLADYYGVLGMGSANLLDALNGAETSLNNQVNNIIKPRPEDREFMGVAPANPLEGKGY